MALSIDGRCTSSTSTTAWCRWCALAQRLQRVVWTVGCRSVTSMVGLHSCLSQLLLLSALFAAASAFPAPSIVYPEDGSRVWADYEENPVRITTHIEHFDMPAEGYARLFANGRDMGVKIEAADMTVSIEEMAEGVHHIVLKCFDRRGNDLGATAETHFQKFTILERADHEEYYVTAEAPRSDGTLQRLPGMEPFHFGVSGNTPEQDELQQLLRRKLSEAQFHRGDQALAAYKERHDKVMGDPSSWKKERFVIFRNIAVGLGNQLESMISAFVFAMVTDRIFLCDATPIHHLFQPPSIEWHYTPLPENIHHDFIYDNSKLVDLRWSNPEDFKQFLCEDLDQSLPQQYVFIFSDQYYMPAMLHNKRYTKKIRQWFGGDIFGTIARWLLKPKPWVAAEVINFYRKNLQQQTVIGVQVRTATMKGYDIEYMAYDSFAWKDFPPAYWKCALLHTPRKLPKGPVKYMLVTDHEAIRPMADEALGEGQVAYYDAEVTRKNMGGHATALIDILLLSLSDDILTTSMSTFGYVSSAWSSVTPVVVTYQSTCLREMTSQPCFHKWSYLMKAKCYDKRQVSPEIRFCGPMTPPQTMAEPVW